jgi:hypothetical protein
VLDAVAIHLGLPLGLFPGYVRGVYVLGNTQEVGQYRETCVATSVTRPQVKWDDEEVKEKEKEVDQGFELVECLS